MTKIMRWLAPALLGSLVFVACVSSGEVPPVDQADAQLVLGQDVYTQNCSRCHLNNGAGGAGPQLSDGQVVTRYPDEAVQRALIVNGQGRMPAFDSLSDDELDAVVRYTREVLDEQPSDS